MILGQRIDDITGQLVNRSQFDGQAAMERDAAFSISSCPVLVVTASTQGGTTPSVMSTRPSLYNLIYG